jgi:hypothetical protein
VFNSAGFPRRDAFLTLTAPHLHRIRQNEAHHSGRSSASSGPQTSGNHDRDLRDLPTANLEIYRLLDSPYILGNSRTTAAHSSICEYLPSPAVPSKRGSGTLSQLEYRQGKMISVRLSRDCLHISGRVKISSVIDHGELNDVPRRRNKLFDGS